MKPTVPTRTRGEINNIDRRDDLLQIACLVDRLTPDRHDPELFHVQKNALAHESQADSALGKACLLTAAT